MGRPDSLPIGVAKQQEANCMNENTECPLVLADTDSGAIDATRYFMVSQYPFFKSPFLAAPRNILLAAVEPEKPKKPLPKPVPGRYYTGCYSSWDGKECVSLAVTDANGKFRIREGRLTAYKSGYLAFSMHYDDGKFFGNSFGEEEKLIYTENLTIELKKAEYEKFSGVDFSRHLQIIACHSTDFRGGNYHDVMKIYCKEARNEMVIECIKRNNLSASICEESIGNLLD